MSSRLPVIDRRTLLVGGGVGAGLLVAWRLWPREEPVTLADSGPATALGGFIRVADDGQVTLASPVSEMGQGSWTALAQVVADELGARWQDMAVEPSPAGAAYANHVALSGGGWTEFDAGRLTLPGSSMAAFEMPLRQAAALVRALLVAEAANRWSLNPADCDLVDSAVVAGPRRLPIGELAEAAVRRRPPSSAPLKGPDSGRLAGQPLSRLDGPARADASWRFAADVRHPDMVYAAIRMAPPGGAITGHDRAAALKGIGVRGLEEGPGWIAAIADSGWAAEQALVRAQVGRSGPTGADSASIAAAFDAAMDEGEATRWLARGEADRLLGSGVGIIAADYEIAAVPPPSLEPYAATARWADGRLKVWAPVLAPDRARAAAAAAAGIADDAVVLFPTPVGGLAGRTLDHPLVAPAAILARRLGRPVQLAMSASESRHHDRCRPPLRLRLKAAPMGGTIGALGLRLVAGHGLEASLDRLGAGRQPALPIDALDGAVPPYGIPSMAIDALAVPLPAAASGYTVGGAGAAARFATESFVDEVAHAMGAEPLSLRVGLLGGNVRLARLLTMVGAISGWDGGGVGSRMGLACAAIAGSYIALVAEAAFDERGHAAATRLVAAVDCGRVINPALVKQRIESGLLAALAEANAPAARFHAGLTVADGRPARGDLARLPSVVVELTDSQEEPGGVSPLAAAVLPAALANALAAGTGNRLRRWPLVAKVSA